MSPHLDVTSVKGRQKKQPRNIKRPLATQRGGKKHHGKMFVGAANRLAFTFRSMDLFFFQKSAGWYPSFAFDGRSSAVSIHPIAAR